MKYFSVFILVCLLVSCSEQEPQILFDKTTLIENVKTEIWPFEVSRTCNVKLELLSSDPLPVDIYIIRATEQNVKKFILRSDFTYTQPFRAKKNFQNVIDGVLNKGTYAVAIKHSGSLGTLGSKQATKVHAKLTIQ